MPSSVSPGGAETPQDRAEFGDEWHTEPVSPVRIPRRGERAAVLAAGLV
jgi:hypothetical protein